MPVAAAQDALRRARAGAAPCYYVVDPEGWLAAVVTPHALLEAEPDAALAQIMHAVSESP